jgi:adenylate cyclase
LAEAERAVALAPNYADGNVDLASVLIEVGRPEQAFGVAEKALRLGPRGPQSAYYLAWLGFAYHWTGRVEEAVAAQRQALLRNPTLQFAYLGLAGSYVWQWAWQLSADPQMLEQGFETAQQAVALDDSLPWTHIALSEVYLRQKQPEQALAEAKRAIALAPNYGLGYAVLAEILSAEGRAEEAIEVAEKAMRIGVPDPHSFLYQLGQAYCLSERYEEAITINKRILIRSPDNWYAHSEQAISYIELGREEPARAEMAEALRLNPNLSLEAVKQTWPYKDPVVLERDLAAMRKAGLE